MSGALKSKTLATWLAVIGGTLGLHRFYLHGAKDWIGWLHWPLTLAGLVGALRMRTLGQDDPVSWVLIPILGVMIAQAMLHAIIYGLTPDEKWDARHNAGAPSPATAWGPVFGVIAALLVGATVLLGTIAFSGQKIFEALAEPQVKAQSPK